MDFTDRRKAFEKKFEHEGELSFKISARAAKMFAEWAAGKTRVPESELQNYIASILDIEMKSARRGELINKVEADFKAGGVNMPRRHIAAEYETIYEQARTTVIGE